MISRHKSRELAVQFIYQMLLRKETKVDMKSLDRFWVEQSRSSLENRPYFEKLVRGAMEHASAIDEAINSVMTNWRLDRVEKVDLAIMRVAVFELLYADEPATAIVIDEAIEIAKTFSTPDSPSFINGILDALAKKNSK